MQLAAFRRLFAPLLGALSGLAVAGAVVLTTHDASAKTSVESTYGFDRTWNAALRLVRVDLGLKIVEKDDAAGYMLFEYKAPDLPKPSSGSIELIRAKDKDANPAVQVIVQLPQMPRYHEMAMADSLTKKMRTEYGEPPARPIQKPTPEPAKDAGVEGMQ